MISTAQDDYAEITQPKIKLKKWFIDQLRDYFGEYVALYFAFLVTLSRLFAILQMLFIQACSQMCRASLHICVGVLSCGFYAGSLHQIPFVSSTARDTSLHF